MTLDNAFDEPVNTEQLAVCPIALLTYSRGINPGDICWACVNRNYGTTSRQSVCELAKETPRNEWPAVENDIKVLVACVYFKEAK